MKGKNKMRNLKTNVIAVVALLLVAVFCFASCNKIDAEGLWENATYRKDVSVGEGSKEVTLRIEIDDQFIDITLKTDAAKLGEAMFAEGLINDATFFDTLNGIKADWDKDKAYWCFYTGEEMMMVGVNDVEIGGGESYRFVYTK